MPTIALLLCGGFIWFLLKLDKQQNLHVANSLWLPTIWLVYFSSKPFSEWLIRSGRSPEPGIVIEQILLLVLAACSIRQLIKRRFYWSAYFQENAPLTALLSLMLVSSFWSDVPFPSFTRWGREVLAVLLGLVVSLENDTRGAIQCILRRAIYILVPISFLLIKWFPSYGSDYHSYSGRKMWIGVCSHKNSLGFLVSITAFYIIWRLFRNRKDGFEQLSSLHLAADVLILIMALWILKGPGWYSAASLIMLAMGMLCYFLLIWMRKYNPNYQPRIFLVLFIFIIIYGVLAVFINILPGDHLTSLVGRRSDLTNRTELWANFVHVALKKPLLGYGFGVKWSSLSPSLRGISPHNGYLEVILRLGFVGLILTGAFVLSSCRKAIRELTQQFDWGVFWICCIMMLLISSVVESTISTFQNLLMALVLWITISNTSPEVKA